MSLGQRSAHAKHATVGVQKQAGSTPTAYHPDDRVMTIDGLLGTVVAVTINRLGEEYQVDLDGGMGGGSYTAAQITTAPHEAVGVHVASDDYPVLQDILRDRPDIATPKFSSVAFTPGQRVLTFDGLSGTVTACLGDHNSSFGGGRDSIYAVVLDNGMGGGEYSANDLRPQTGTNTPIMHQADMTSSSQMDGSFEDTATGDGPGGDYHEEGGDLQTGASLWHLAADTKDKPWGEYKNPTEHSRSWKGEHQDFEPEHHPMARERHYPMGGGGDADHNNDGSPMPEDVSKEYEPPHLYSLNSLDPDFGFHVHASWADVRDKAKRLRSEGHVRITEASDGLIIGEVRGDHHVYEAGLQRLPGKSSIQAWSCGCKWGAYHWGADDDMSRFAGRQCSHSLALQYEAQSRGMFGNKIVEDFAKPKWVPRQVVVKYDINDGQNQMAKSSSLQVPEISPMEYFSNRVDVPSLLFAAKLDMEAAVNNSWGEPGPTDLQVAPKPFGATQQRDPKANPGSTGFASTGDPDHWTDIAPGANGSDSRYAALSPQDYEMIFEASGEPDCGNDYEMMFEASGGTDVNADWVSKDRALLTFRQHNVGGNLLKRHSDDGGGWDVENDDGEYTGTHRTKEGAVGKLADHYGISGDLNVHHEPGDTGVNVRTHTKVLKRAASDTGMPGMPEPGQNDSAEYEQATPTLGGGDRPHALLGERPKEESLPAPDLAGPGYPSGPKGGQGGEMPPGEPKSPEHQEPGAEATLHEEPEGALPATDGGLANIMAANEALLSQSGLSMSEGDATEEVSEDDQALTPAHTANIQSIVEQFQKSAGYIMEGSSLAARSGEFGDVAAAAKAHLEKLALKDYSPAEQASIINEGAHASAGNLDRLILEGTHYIDGDDDAWLS